MLIGQMSGSTCEGCGQKYPSLGGKSRRK